MSPPTQRTVTILKELIAEVPSKEHFASKTEDLPELADNQLLLEALYFSVDPYLRAKMSGVKDSYFEPFEAGKPVSSGAVARVLASKNPDYQEGDRITYVMDWSDYQVVTPDVTTTKLAPNVPAEVALSACGITGLTAYFGLLDVGRLESYPVGSTVFVSGAAGATGNVVGQIAKLKGYRVVGTAGTDEKVQWLVKTLNFDAAINYKKTTDLTDSLRGACPNGIDVYFDNVGGTTLDIALNLMNSKGTIVNCGAISTYNHDRTVPLLGPRVEWSMISKRLRMEGFIVTDFMPRFGAGIKEISGWVQEGKLKVKTTQFSKTGAENVHLGWMEMMTGSNVGKMIVKA